MHHHIDSLACQNRLRGLPPSHKFAFAAFLFILGYITPPPWQISIAIWLSVWIVVYAGIPYQTYCQLQGIPLSFWLLSWPALVLSGGLRANWADFGADVWWGIPLGEVYLYLSRQGMAQGIEVLTRSLALSSSMYFILLTIPLSQVLRLLQGMGCPRLLLELLSLMYRFIFLLTDTVLELLNAQQARLGYANWKTAMRSLALVVSQLLRRTLDNYRQISLGLASRGFQGELRFWHSSRHRPSWRYGIEAGAGCLLLLASLGWHDLC